MEPSSPAPPPVFDAIAFLEDEHARTRELLTMLLGRSLTRCVRNRVVGVLSEDLWIHLQLEDELLYPALAHVPTALAKPSAARWALRHALPDLERCRYEQRDIVAVARRVLVLHYEDSEHEERHVFPCARRVLDVRALEELRVDLLRRRQILRAGLVRREGPPSTQS